MAVSCELERVLQFSFQHPTLFSLSCWLVRTPSGTIDDMYVVLGPIHYLNDFLSNTGSLVYLTTR